MRYTNTFVQVAPDSPPVSGVIPPAKGEGKTVAMIQYELLSEHPYKFTQDELIFQTHIRHKGISPGEARRNRESIWKELFRKPHPCLRTSPLPKKYGWGVHYDEEGRIAIWARDSREYQRFTTPRANGPQLVFAMRSKRA